MTDIPKMLRAEAVIADEDWTGIYQIPPDLAFAAADHIEKLEAALTHIWAWYPVNVSKPHETIDAIKDYAFAVIKGEIKDD
jgi:hypothetical protein